MFEKECGDILGIPASVTQAALFPVAYYTGSDFKPAERQSTTERTFWNQWGKARS
jgi:hypothetical protein